MMRFITVFFCQRKVVIFSVMLSLQNHAQFQVQPFFCSFTLVLFHTFQMMIFRKLTSFTVSLLLDLQTRPKRYHSICWLDSSPFSLLIWAQHRMNQHFKFIETAWHPFLCKITNLCILWDPTIEHIKPWRQVIYFSFRLQL